MTIVILPYTYVLSSSVGDCSMTSDDFINFGNSRYPAKFRSICFTISMAGILRNGTDYRFFKA